MITYCRRLVSIISNFSFSLFHPPVPTVHIIKGMFRMRRNKKLPKYIPLNDIYLTIYFVILLISLLVSLLFPLPSNDVRNSLDVVLRTAVAVLCGYFLSSDLGKNSPPKPIAPPPKKLYQNNVVAWLGLFSLCVLIAARYSEKAEFSAGTLSQIRDLYLASVAFLMGNSRS